MVIILLLIFYFQPHDDLSQMICADCMQKAIQAFHFKAMCRDSHIYLQNYLNENSRIKTENEINIEGTEIVSVQVPGFNAQNDYLDESVDDGLYKTEVEQVEELEEVDEKDEDFRLVNNARKVNGRYCCEFCDKTLADRRTFLLHIRLHLGKNLKHCEICNRGFAKQNHLDRHKVTHSRKHSNGEQDLISFTKINDSAKIRSEKEENQRKRPRRECYSKNEAILNHHMTEDVHEGKHNETVSIPIDEEESQLLNSAKEINGRLQCPLCPKTLSQRKILKLHIRSHVGKNLLHCKICNRGFAKGSNLNRHMLLHRDMDSDEENRIITNAKQNDGRYSCPYCNKTLIDRQTFRLHIRLHISKLFVRCDVCNQAFENDDKLQEHMPTHGDQFSCNKCDNSFKTYQERMIHLKEAHETNDNSKVTEHTNTSGEDRNEMKDNNYCKNNYNDGDDDEDKHLVNRSNLVDGRYECEFCKKTLANRTTLKYHIRLHLQKHLLKCDICNQGFSKKSHLKRHLATHVKKKGQPCRYCDAVFDSYELRKAHTAAIHKKVVQNQSNKTFITCYTQPNGVKQCICMICDMQFEHIYELSCHIQAHMKNPQSFKLNLLNISEKKELLSKFNNIGYNCENIGDILYKTLERSPQEISKMYRITNSNGWELSLSDSETDEEQNLAGSIPEHKYDCGQCRQSFDRVHKLMCHMKVDHDQRFRDFKCSYCMQCFPNSIILAKHMRQQCENDQKKIICSMCNCKFLWESSLERHLTVYHETEKKFVDEIQNNSKPFSCKQCSRSFSTEALLEAHASYHLPRPKRFSCEICEKLFSRSDNLK